MFDNIPPIPDAESLPFYPLVLKLVVCVSGRLPQPSMAEHMGVRGRSGWQAGGFGDGSPTGSGVHPGPGGVEAAGGWRRSTEPPFGRRSWRQCRQ